MGLFLLNGVSGFSYSLGYFFPSIIGVILLSVHSSKKAKQKVIEEFTARPADPQPQNKETFLSATPVQDDGMDEILAHCSAIAHDYQQLERYIISCINSGKIASQIWKAYYSSQK